MPVTLGDLIVAIGILLLYVELIKSVRPGGKSMVDHLLSLILFLAMAGELLFVPRATSSTLLLLTVLGFVDFIAGLSVRFAQPKIVFERAAPAQPVHQASDHP